jgi:diguanylate cyclase (GGDEF)-like protein
VHAWAIPLRDKTGSIIGIIQTFEGDFAVAGPDPNDRSMKECGCLDDATGLPNQAMMQSHLREMLGTFAELQIPFGIFCIELYELSQFRARYGQEAAASMLQVLARTLRNTVWPTDFVGRWSESQFLVILSGCGEEALQSVSERLLKMMASATIPWWGEELSIGVSMGRTGALAGDSVESLVLRAQPAVGANQLALPGRAVALGAAHPSSKS